LPAFTRLLADPDASVRRAVVKAARRYQQAALPLFLEAFKDRDSAVRHQALVGLQTARGDQAKVLPALASLLKDTDPDIRLAAAQTLWQYDKAALPHYQQALKDPDRKVQQAALSSLQNLKSNLKEILPALRLLLVSSNAATRSAAFQVLGHAGKDGLPVLLDTLQHQDERIRLLAIQTMPTTGKMAKDTAAALSLVMSKDASSQVRIAAAVALAHQGAESVPALLKAVRHEKDGSVRQAELESLVAFPKRANETLPLFLEAMKDRSAGVRATAAGSLGKLAPNSGKVVQALAAALADPSPAVRQKAAATLGQIGPTARAALPALTQATEDASLPVRQSAQAALERIREK
jgi:HEAT repeat protein